MDLKDNIEVANTRKKLRQLEALRDKKSTESGDDEELREASMRSIQRLINQLKEELARHEAHKADPSLAS